MTYGVAQRMLDVKPTISGVVAAGEIVSTLAPNMILHAGPPTSWESMCPLLRATVAGGIVFEGLASSLEEAEALASNGEIELSPAQDHAAISGGAGVITRSTPVIAVTDPDTGRRAAHFVLEPFGKSLALGVFDDEVLARLQTIRDELAPTLDAAVQAGGGIDVEPLMAEALRRGDELHNRNAAATSMLTERLALGMLEAGVDNDLGRRSLALVSENPQFFVAVSLATARLALGAASGVAGSPLVVAAGANGTECGIKIAAFPDTWFTAPAEAPHGPLLPGFVEADVGLACGDSLTVECYGMGAAALLGAPALWELLGIGAEKSKALFENAHRFAAGFHENYRLPALDNAPLPAGVDAQRVVETGQVPTIDIVMLHREPSRGVVGFGLTELPYACFAQAVTALEDSVLSLLRTDSKH